MAKSEPAVLRRLGPVPFWRGEEKCLDAPRRMYERAMEHARALASNTQTRKQPKHTPSP